MTIYLIIQLNIKFAIYFTDQERLLFLEIYYQLYDLALQSQEIIDNPDWDIDNWEIDVKIILILLTCYSQGNPNNLKYVLWESPQVLKIKLASPKLEYEQQVLII